MVKGKPIISRKKWNHIENAEKYASSLRKKGYEARAFSISRGNNRVEYRKKRR